MTLNQLVNFTNARYGAWIVNIGQGLSHHAASEDLSRFEEIINTSKLGKFLQTVVTDKEKTITA